MRNIKYQYLLLLLGMQFASQHYVSAQTSIKNYGDLYLSPNALMSTFELKTDALLTKESYISAADTKVKLVSTEGYKVKINNLRIHKKALKEVLLAEKVKASTVLFGKAYDCGKCNKTHISSSTGYIIDPDGIIVTNYHVIENFTEGEIALNKAMTIMTASDEVFLITDILSSYKDADLAIVKVDTKGKKLHALPLGAPAKQGQEIFVMSHPSHRFYYWTKGVVARNLMRKKARNMKYDLPEMEITADYAAGSSGGPVVDVNGNVVATVSSTNSIYYKPQDQKDFQMTVKQTVPVVLLKELIQ